MKRSPLRFNLKILTEHIMSLQCRITKDHEEIFNMNITWMEIDSKGAEFTPNISWNESLINVSMVGISLHSQWIHLFNFTWLLSISNDKFVVNFSNSWSQLFTQNCIRFSPAWRSLLGRATMYLVAPGLTISIYSFV